MQEVLLYGKSSKNGPGRHKLQFLTFLTMASMQCILLATRWRCCFFLHTWVAWECLVFVYLVFGGTHHADTHMLTPQRGFLRSPFLDIFFISGVNSCGKIYISASCYPECLNGGLCLGGEKGCSCPRGFGGLSCEQEICTKKCENGGICTLPGNKCRCEDTYYGDHCQKR